MTQTTAVAPAQEPAFESDSLHIPDSDRRGWWSIACIWIGNSINVSTLMTLLMCDSLVLVGLSMIV